MKIKIHHSDSLRRAVNEHLEDTGEPIKHLAKRSGLSTASLKGFLKKDKKITDTTMDSIELAIWNYKTEKK